MTDDAGGDAIGPVRVSGDGRHLERADTGRPFFYLADTAWNGALLASEADWREYLADRKAKGFTAIQFILAAPWLAAPADAEGRISYRCDDALGPGEYEVNEDFFRRMDDRVRAVNEARLLAVPVLAWAANKRTDPGLLLPVKFLVQLIEYAVRRYASHHVMWVLAGDEWYGLWRSWKWKWIGRRVFGGGLHAPVALHPRGMTWPYGSFRRERWLDVVGYQSSHSDAPATLRWLLDGPPARAWRRWRKPFINLEPCYEGICNWGEGGSFTNGQVRRAMYASLLNAPTAGVAYGAHGVWSWEREAREPLNHRGTGVARPWREAMGLPGSFDCQRIAGFFTSIDWWRLRPEPQLVDQPKGDWSRFVSAARADEGDLAVLYLPKGGPARLNRSLVAGLRGEWFDPRTGRRHDAEVRDGDCAAPSGEDWVLLFHK